MDLHYLRDTRQRYLDEQVACHKRISETDDPRVLNEAGDRLDKIQRALDASASVFALLDGLDELAERVAALEMMEDVAEKVWAIAGGERDALAERVMSLEKGLDDTDLITSKRCYALEQEVANSWTASASPL